MYKLPFYIGNIISYFVPGHKRRQRVRGYINVFLYRIPIALFVKRVYGVRIESVKYVRQITMNRMCCVVNDKYFVKVFRNVSVKQLNNYKFLLDFIRPQLKVQIPEIFVAKHIPMYVSEKCPGKDVYYFDRPTVVKNEEKIKTQVFDIINSIQSVSFDSIPDNKRFIFGLQKERVKEKPYNGKRTVLAHFDLNETNFLMDDNFNILSVIDWDGLSVAQNPDTDKSYFLKMWEKYKNKKNIIRK